MALSGSTNYNNALTSTIKEEWLFEFRNQDYPSSPIPADTSDEIIRLATAEVPHSSISDMKYHGFITNTPSIRESIDLNKSTSTVSNISITCANGTLSNHSKTLAEEIYGGSNNYINRDVIVRSRVGGYTEIIFQGRLKEVKLSNQDTVSIVIAVHDPIQDISIPEYQSKSGNYFPIFYGESVPETSTVLVPDFIDASIVFPVEVDTLNNDVFNCLFHQAESSDARLHYPVKDTFNANEFPIMCPLDDTFSNATYDDYEGATSDTNRNVMRTDLDLHRAYKVRPQTVTNPSSGSGVTVTNPGNAYDDNASTDADFTAALNTDVTVDKEYVISDIPKEEHALQTLKFFYNYSITGYGASNGNLHIHIGVAIKHDGSYSAFKEINKSANQSADTEELNLLSNSDFSNATNKTPEEVKLRIRFINSASDDGGDNNLAVVNLFDTFFQIETKIVDDNDTDELQLANSSAVTSVKRLYTGADGFDESWNAGTVVNLIHDMHRDILYRFAGVTATPDGYSALDTDRQQTGFFWFCRYYTHKPIEIKKLLEQCQYEGGFIFRFRPSNQTPQYIHIPDSPTTIHTIDKNDITNLNISVTPFESLVTKRIIKYEINPINDKTMREITCTDTSASPTVRTKYNIDTKENIKTDELKILRNSVGQANMGGARNNGFANYYNAIEGNPKLVVDTEIINPGSSGGSSYFYLMEVGDICAFNHNDMIVEPFGESFNGKQFIVTSLTRSPGSLKVSLREI
jgi:hypothetical protein